MVFLCLYSLPTCDRTTDVRGSGSITVSVLYPFLDYIRKYYDWVPSPPISLVVYKDKMSFPSEGFVCSVDRSTLSWTTWCTVSPWGWKSKYFDLESPNWGSTVIRQLCLVRDYTQTQPLIYTDHICQWLRSSSVSQSKESDLQSSEMCPVSYRHSTQIFYRKE